MVTMKTKTGDLKLSDLSKNMKNILTVLLDGKTRSTNDLQKKLVIPATTLRKALNRLHLFELVDEVQNRNGNLWSISQKGLELLKQQDESLVTEKQQPELSRQETESQCPDQETVVGVPDEKALKPQEKLTLGFVAFWLEGKAQEFQEMARMMRTQIETNEHRRTVKQ